MRVIIISEIRRPVYDLDPKQLWPEARVNVHQ